MSTAQQILPLVHIEPEIFTALTRELGFVPGRTLRAVPAAATPDVAATAEAVATLELPDMSDVSTETPVALVEVPDPPALPPLTEPSALAELTAAPTLVALGPARPTPVAADEAVAAPRSAGVVPPGLGSYQPHDEVVEEDSFVEPSTVVLDVAVLEEIPQVEVTEVTDVAAETFEVAEVTEVTDVPDGTDAGQADQPVDVADQVGFFARRVPSMPPIARGDR